MWKIKPEDRQDLSFEFMEPLEVLYEFDNALIFIFKKSERLFFAYLADDDASNRSVRYLVVATDEQEIANLKFGKFSVYEVLDKYYVWAVDRSFDDEFLEQVCLRGLAAVPNSHKPLPSAMLHANLRKNETISKVETQRAHDAWVFYGADRLAAFDRFSLSRHESSEFTSSNDFGSLGASVALIAQSLAESTKKLDIFAAKNRREKSVLGGEAPGTIHSVSPSIERRVMQKLHGYSVGESKSGDVLAKFRLTRGLSHG